MSAQRFSSTFGAAKRRAKKRKGEEVAKIAGSMHKFIVVNKPESQNSTTMSVEVEISHANNVNEINKALQFNNEIPEGETTISTDDSTVSLLNACEEQQANETVSVTTHDNVEANIQQSDKNCQVTNSDNDSPPEIQYNANMNNNLCDEKLDNACACVGNHETLSQSEDMIALAESNDISFSDEGEESSCLKRQCLETLQ